jgi:hypothetical protein
MSRNRRARRRRASELTRRQSALYAEDLAAGVSEKVVAGSDASLSNYIAEWSKA